MPSKANVNVCLFHNLNDGRYWFIKKGTSKQVDDHVKRYLEHDETVLKISKEFINDQIEKDRVVKDSDMKSILQKIKMSKDIAKSFVKYYRNFEDSKIEIELNQNLRL